MTQETPAEGRNFVFTSEATPLPDDAERPCAYCNNEAIIQERLANVEANMTEVVVSGSDDPSHYDMPLPEGVTVEVDIGDEQFAATITDHATNDATESVVYETEDHGKVAADYMVSLLNVPERYGTVFGDYTFRFGDGPGAAQLAICEGCLHDMVVEHADSDIRDLPYEYDSEGKVVTKVREERDDERAWVVPKEVDEHGNIVGEV